MKSVVQISMTLLFLYFVALAVPSVVAAGEKVVCFGDSATAGAVDLSFPDYLEFFIEPGDGEVQNEGESGETTADGIWRLFWLVISLEYYDADVWTYWQGGNDLIDWVEENDPYMLYDPSDPNYPLRDELDEELWAIKTNIGIAVELIHATGAEVILGTYYELVPWLPCSPSPIGFFTPGMADKANHYQAVLNDAIREVATDKGVPLNDMAANLSLLSGHIIYYHDCNHANALGNFAIALSWWTEILPYI